MNDHWKRLWWAIQDKWEPEYQIGRKSEHKGYIGEVTHAAKNVLVEWLRETGIWNRKNRDPDKPDGYNWP